MGKHDWYDGLDEPQEKPQSSVPILVPRPGRDANIRDMVQRIPNLDVRETLLSFVDDFDVTKCRTFEDLAVGFQGLFTLNLMLGQDRNIRGMLELGSKILGRFADTKKAFLELEFPQELENNMNRKLDLLVDALKDRMTEEAFNHVKGVLAEYGATAQKTD